jgi:hypothetical protein
MENKLIATKMKPTNGTVELHDFSDNKFNGLSAEKQYTVRVKFVDKVTHNGIYLYSRAGNRNIH